jgi:CheY-like chemotaxis protein
LKADVRAFAEELLDPLLASGQSLGSLPYKLGDHVNGYLVSAEDLHLIELLVAHERAVIQAIESDDLLRLPFCRPVHIPVAPDSSLVAKRIPTGPWSVLRRLSNSWADSFAKEWTSAVSDGDRWAVLKDELNFRRAVLGLVCETHPEFWANRLWRPCLPLYKSVAVSLRSVGSPVSLMSELFRIAKSSGRGDIPVTYDDFKAPVLAAVNNCVVTFVRARHQVPRVRGDLAAPQLPPNAPGFLFEEGSVLLPSLPPVLPWVFYAFSRVTVEERASFRMQALCGFIAYNRGLWPLVSVWWPEADTGVTEAYHAPGEGSPLRSARGPRIVMLDDEPYVLDALKMMIQLRFKEAVVKTFTDPDLALDELLREDPDLFTTDWMHPKPSCVEVLERLRARKVSYPIFVISLHAEMVRADGLIPDALYRDLNLTVVGKPLFAEELWSLLSSRLGLPVP